MTVFPEPNELNDGAAPIDPLASIQTARAATSRAVGVVIIGGGPAGSAIAIALAQLGWSATILERSHYESTRIGETFPPEIKRSLIALGVWEQVLADDRTVTTLAASSARSLNRLRIFASVDNQSLKRRVRFGTLSVRDGPNPTASSASVAILSWESVCRKLGAD